MKIVLLIGNCFYQSIDMCELGQGQSGRVHRHLILSVDLANQSAIETVRQKNRLLQSEDNLFGIEN